jgi:hypothetical protein
MKKVIAALAALVALAVVAPVASASPYLTANQARAAARDRAMTWWTAPRWSKAYLDGWDRVDSDRCFRGGASQFECTVSVSISDYAYNSAYDFSYGYAYCVGNVTVTRDRWGIHTPRVYSKKCDASA